MIQTLLFFFTWLLCELDTGPYHNKVTLSHCKMAHSIFGIYSEFQSAPSDAHLSSDSTHLLWLSVHDTQSNQNYR